MKDKYNGMDSLEYEELVRYLAIKIEIDGRSRTNKVIDNIAHNKGLDSLTLLKDTEQQLVRDYSR